MRIYLVNESTVLSDAEIVAALPAFQQYCSHVAAAWHLGPSTLTFGVPPDANEWQIVILDDSDQAGALGYHDYVPGGKPIAKVFAKTDRDYGYSWTVTLTHELAEMLADPDINDVRQTSATQLYATEVGDAVEADKFGYLITTAAGLAVTVSDFITPAWFVPGCPGPYDHARHCTAPLQLLSGGYCSIFVSGKGWTTKTMREGRLVTAGDDDNRFREGGRFRGR